MHSTHPPLRSSLPLLALAGLVVLTSACDTESDVDVDAELLESDDAFDGDDAFALDDTPDTADEPAGGSGTLVAPPSDHEERLAFHGKTALTPTTRPAASVPLVALEDGLAATDVERMNANNGARKTLFARVRGDDGSSTWVDGEVRSTLLDDASIDPMDMNFAAVAAQADVDLQVDIRVVKDRETGKRVITEQLLYNDENPAPVAPAVWNETASSEALTRMVEAELDGADDPVILDDGRTLVYAAFSPKLPWDTQERVAWFETQTSREKAILEAEAERKGEVAELVERSLTQLDALGQCELVQPSNVQNAAWIACDEDELRTLAERGDYFLQALDVIGHGQPQGVDGDEVRSATGSQTQIALSQTHDGRHGTSGRSTVEVALLDGQGFYRAAQHPGFDDWANGPSRVSSVMTCSTTSCWNDAINGSSGNHGSTAMLGAFSHVLQGQDSTVTTTAAREDRSHGAYEAEVEAYRWLAGGGEPGLIRASDPSVDQGVDMAVISWGNNDCGNELAYTAWRDAWDYAYSQGVFGVISATNAVNRTNDNCTSNGWASRPDMLVVGAFGDNVNGVTNGKPATPLSSWDYDTQPIMGWHWTDLANSLNCSGTNATCWHSAYGGGELRFSSSTVRRARSVVDVTAPAGRELAPRMSGTSAIYGNQCCGTSQAAPNAAAAAVTFKDWAITDGHTSFNDPGFMHVAMLLMGDGTGSGTNPDPGAAPTNSTSGMNWVWGAGRLKMRLWDDVGLDGPWAWGVGGFYIHDGDTVDVVIGGNPMSSDVDAWTGVLSWNEPWIDADATNRHAADIVFRVVTTDPVGGQCVNPQGSSNVTTVYSDLSFDPTKRIRLRPGVIEQLHGKCAWMRFQAYNIPADQNGYNRRFVYRGDMWEDLDRESFENLTDIE